MTGNSFENKNFQHLNKGDIYEYINVVFTITF
jgi:hypothetical protein